jgi:hypothetical protein
MKFLHRHPIITSLLLTPILLAIAAISGGVEHGNYTLAIVLFPYAALTVVALDRFFNATIVMILIATLQFPAYGTLLSIGRHKETERIVVVGLLVLHILATVLALLVVRY